VKLPKGDRAVVSDDKLVRYCLDQTHPRGKHKARVFAEALGMTLADAMTLRTTLLHAAALCEAALRT
jgi:hypothetical protein